MSWAVVAGAGIAAGGSLLASKNVNKATAESNEQAAQVNQLERDKFEQAKVEAEKLRQAGDEASAVALEEAAKAELGAQQYEALSNHYAQNADAQAALRQRYARDIYAGTQNAANARQIVGQQGAAAIRNSAGMLMDQAGATDKRLTEALGKSNAYLDSAFSDINTRFQPFMDSERKARGQLDVEMGLVEGDPNRGYRTSSGYGAMMDASRAAEEDAIRTIDTAAGNTGTLYSGSRGAALMDRANRGSWERAAVEQSYFQNYMDMLTQMANPTSTNTVSGYQAGIADRKAGMGLDTARNISDAYMSAAGTGLNAEMAAQEFGLNSMRTGMEGAELLNYMDPGDAGAKYALTGFDHGTAGSPYRMQAQDYKLNAAQAGAGLITGNMPTGVNSASLVTSAANEGAASKNAMLADLIKAGATLYGNYMPSGTQNPIYAGGNTNPKYPYMA